MLIKAEWNARVAIASPCIMISTNAASSHRRKRKKKTFEKRSKKKKGSKCHKFKNQDQQLLVKYPAYFRNEVTYMIQFSLIPAVCILYCSITWLISGPYCLALCGTSDCLQFRIRYRYSKVSDNCLFVFRIQQKNQRKPRRKRRLGGVLRQNGGRTARH